MTISTSDMMFVAAALVCSGIGAVYDIRERRIPNALTGPAIALGLVLHLVHGGWSQLASSLGAGLIAGGLFLALFLLGGMGAGDVKLMTAVGCLGGLRPLREIVLATVVSGALYALMLAFRRGRWRELLVNMEGLAEHHREHGWQPHPELNVANTCTLHLPYAVAITAGCLVTACSLAGGAR